MTVLYQTKERFANLYLLYFSKQNKTVFKDLSSAVLQIFKYIPTNII
jgi:hypothetical protein